jgi:hypothetical protein
MSGGCNPILNRCSANVSNSPPNTTTRFVASPSYCKHFTSIGRYLSFLLLTRHDKKFCSRMDDIDLFKDSRRVICQSLFSKMIHNKFEMTIRTEGRSHDFSEFVNGVDIAQNRWSVNLRGKKENVTFICAL